MPPTVVLRQALRAIALRMRACTFAQRLAWALLAGLVPACVLLVAQRTGLLFRMGWATLPEWAGFVPVALAGLAGVVWGVWIRVSDFEAAHAADVALRLKERLGSAVVFANRPPRAALLLPALLADAARCCQGLRAKDVTGPLFRRRHAAVPVLGCALAALWFMPQLYLFTSENEVNQRKAVQAQGARLLSIAKELEKKSQGANLEGARRSARKIESLGKDFARGAVGKRDAMKQLAELTDELRAEHARAAQSAETKNLENALSNAARESYANDDVSTMAQDLAAADLDAAKREAEKLEQKLRSGEMTPEEQAALAQDLDKLSQKLQGTEAQNAADSLQQAAEALRQGDAQQAADQLKQGAQQMGENAAARSLAESEQMQQAARELEFAEDQVARGRVDSQQNAPQQGSEQSAGGERQGEQGGQGQQNQEGAAGGQGQQGDQQNGQGANQQGGDQQEGGQQGGGPEDSSGMAGEAQPFEGPYDDGMQKYNGGSPDYLRGDSRNGTKVAGKNTRVRGQIRNGDRAPSVDVQGLGPRSDTKTPLYSVGAPSRAEVEDALDRESVPAGSRPLVQGYFNAIRGR